MQVWKYKNWIIDPGDRFIYRVELFVYTSNRYWLESSKLYACNKFIDGIIEDQFFYYKNYSLEKETELIEAPIEWLETNAEFINIETKKEKNERLRLQRKKEHPKDKT